MDQTDALQPMPPAPAPAPVVLELAADRAALLRVLAQMPEESFGWFVGWANGLMLQYPDGLGGFMPESRTAITQLRAEALRYSERANPA